MVSPPSPAGEVPGISSPDRTHVPPGGEDLQEARASAGALLPDGSRLHLRRLRRVVAQEPRHGVGRPRVEEEDGEPLSLMGLEASRVGNVPRAPSLWERLHVQDPRLKNSRLRRF